jgi:hypothetical protein
MRESLVAILLACCGGNDAVDDACAGVTCAGHGTCEGEGPAAHCVCDAGFEPAGLQCVPVEADADVDTDGDTDTGTGTETDTDTGSETDTGESVCPELCDNSANAGFDDVVTCGCFASPADCLDDCAAWSDGDRNCVANHNAHDDCTHYASFCGFTCG